MVSRRKFIKTTAAGAAFAGSSGIFFPKPASSRTINYLLSVDGTSGAVLNTLQAANISRNSSQRLPPATEPSIVNAVEEVQNVLIAQGFDANPTPFTQRLGNPNNPLWGRQKNEIYGPNPGFGTVQIQRNEILPISFTGSTTAGIDSAIQILGIDDKYTPEELDNALIPVRERFEDWGSWLGDIDPVTGEIEPRSLANYDTRYGSVLRIYEVKDPGPDGFGVITFHIRGGQRINETVEVIVQFSGQTPLN